MQGYFGPNAFSGAINIITTPEQEKYLKLSLSGGQFGDFRAAVSGAYNIGGVNNYISLSNERSDGYMKNTDFNITNAFYYLDKQFKSFKLEFQTGYQYKECGENAFYSLQYPDEYEKDKPLLVA